MIIHFLTVLGLSQRQGVGTGNIFLYNPTKRHVQVYAAVHGTCRWIFPNVSLIESRQTLGHHLVHPIKQDFSLVTGTFRVQYGSAGTVCVGQNTVHNRPNFASLLLPMDLVDAMIRLGHLLYYIYDMSVQPWLNTFHFRNSSGAWMVRCFSRNGMERVFMAIHSKLYADAYDNKAVWVFSYYRVYLSVQLVGSYSLGSARYLRMH